MLERSGPPGQRREIGTSILLAIVTLGIYTLVWTYRTFKELRDYAGKGMGGGVALLIGIFVSAAIYFLAPYEIESAYTARGEASPVSAVTGFWLLLPLLGSLVWFVKVQGALNRLWEDVASPA